MFLGFTPQHPPPLAPWCETAEQQHPSAPRTEPWGGRGEGRAQRLMRFVILPGPWKEEVGVGESRWEQREGQGKDCPWLYDFGIS